MSVDFKTPRSLLDAYKNGFIGSICDPEDVDKLLGELPHPLFGAAAYDLVGSGEGKIALLYKNVQKFDPGFGPSERQSTGDCQNGSDLVTMADGSLKQIKNIKIGDYVISAFGEKRKVTHTFKKPYNKKMVELTLANHTKVASTPDHRYIVDNTTMNTRPIETLRIGDKVFAPLDGNMVEIVDVKIVEPEEQFVYCIEVEKDHNFICNGIGINNCVSHSTRNAIDVTRSTEIIGGEREEWVARSATEAIYGSRGHGGQGMSCSGAARFVHQSGGILLRKNYGFVDLSKYNGGLGAGWGRRGVPSDVVAEAKKHQVKTISNIRTVEEARDAIANGYAISVCSGYGFSSRRDKNGIAKKSGGWSHAMAWVAMDDSREIFNETLFLVQNCYSDDTEILTDSGWFLFKDLPKDARVATLNRETKTLEYHLPLQYQEFDYSGKMLNFKSKNKDCLVTPNHNMLYMNSNQVLLQYDGRLDFAEASKIKKNSKFIKFAQNWEAENKIEKVNILGKDIDINLWLEFLGFFLSEGWSSVRTRERKRKSGLIYVENDGYTGISQNEGPVLEDMKRICDLLPWKFSVKETKKNSKHYQLICYSLDLATYMSKFGKAQDKHIPNYVFTLSREKQQILFDAMMKGDGYSTGKGYTTCSKKLRDTFQQLCIHLGYSTDYYLVHKAGDIINGFTANHDFYRISINKSEFKQGNYSVVSAGTPKEIDYNGKVYCVTVQNNTVMTRRNGKTLWSGQSWGVWNGGPKRFDQPDGSFWIREGDARGMLSGGGAWVLSDVDGFPPRKVDWTLDEVF